MPGQAFLRRLGRRPSSDEWRRANYWRECLPDLKAAYRTICAYTGCWIPTSASVDHFTPKSVSRRLAYEWANYRLSSDKINNNKGESVDVLDPFGVRDGWFALDFHSFFVQAGSSETAPVQERICRTIRILRLNDDNWVGLRFEIVRDYSRKRFNFDYLEERYPFIAYEMARQGLKYSILGTLP